MPKPKSGKIKIHILMTPEIKQKIERMCKENFRSRGEQIEYLINHAIRDLEGRSRTVI